MTKGGAGEIVEVLKVNGDRVEIGLPEFIEMCNKIRGIADLEEANTWLKTARQHLVADNLNLERRLEAARQLQQQPEMCVYKRKGDKLYIQLIEHVVNDNGCLIVTISDPN